MQKEEIKTEPEGESTAAAEAAPAGKPRKRMKLKDLKKLMPPIPRFNSIRTWTLFNYILYAGMIIILLWVFFIIILLGFFGTMLQNDFKRVGDDALALFPQTYNEEEMRAFEDAMILAARRNSASISVFTTDAGYDVRFYIDTLGNVTEKTNETFTTVMNNINFNKVFVEGGGQDMITTPIGSFMCYGCRRDMTGGDTTQYLLMIAPYELLNTRTGTLILVFFTSTSLVAVGALLMALFVSGRQTRLLTNLSQSAKQLADGDYKAEFSGGGYEEFDNLAGALNTAKNEMIKAAALRRDMTANVSHDLRTPLTMIRAYAEMLRDMPVDPKKRSEIASVIITEADRLTTLTNDMLDLSKLQAGVAQLTFNSCDIADVTRRVLRGFDIFRERDGVVFDTELPETAAVLCDEARIEQVLYNLIINAINYRGDDNKIKVRVLASDGEPVRVEVGDNGKGIPPEEIDQVWDRYYRAAQTKRTTIGSGIGLSICKNILTLHETEFGVESEVGVGTVFWFKLKTP